MALPQTVRVKLSSEAAGAIALTPVVVRELPVRELVEHMLAIAAKDEARIREILLRGTLVSGASRFRWTGWEADAESLRELLATFPDPDPSRAFAAANCVRAVLRGGRQPIEIPREAGARRSVWKRGNFWELLMEVTAAGESVYDGYCYRARADRYRRAFSREEVDRLRTGAGMVVYSTLGEQIRSAGFDAAECFVER